MYVKNSGSGAICLARAKVAAKQHDGDAKLKRLREVVSFYQLVRPRPCAAWTTRT